MGSFRCYDNSDVIATLMMTNCHLNTTVVAIFPNVCLRRRIEPPSYARTAYVVVIFLFDSFVKIWATWKIFWGKWFTAPPGKKFPVRLCCTRTQTHVRRPPDQNITINWGSKWFTSNALKWAFWKFDRRMEAFPFGFLLHRLTYTTVS